MKPTGQGNVRKKLITVLLLICLVLGMALPASAVQAHNDVTLTADDRQFISTLQPIKVAVNDDFLPLEGYDKGSGKSIGFVVNLLKHISEQSGLKFEFTSVNSLSAATELLEQGAVDMLADYDTKTQLLSAAQCTDVYLKASLLIVGNKNFKYDGSRITIAISERSNYLKDELLCIYPDSEFLLCHNAQELFGTVDSGKADVLVRNVYSVQSELAGNYSDLAIVYDTEQLAEYRFAFSEETDARLIGLMNRYVASITETEKNQMLVASTLSNLNTIDTVQMVRVLVPVVVFVCILLLALLFLILRLHRKNKKIQQMLSQKNEYDEVLSSRAMLEGMFDMVCEVDVTNDLAASSTCCKMKNRLGLPENCTYSELAEALATKTVREEYQALHRDTFNRENILKRFAEGDTVRTIDVIRKQDLVNYVWNRLTICTYQSAVTGAVKAVLYVKNIQSEKDVEQKLVDEASTDVITGLYNKRSAQRRVNQILERSDPTADFHALLVIDVDHFKVVNDTLGHSIGDEVLKSVAGMMKSCFRERDVTSRIGGDEFMVFMKDCKSAEAAVRRARELLSLLRATYESASIGMIPTLSIGISLYPAHADNYTDLFVLADAALYEVKNGGRNGFRIFSSAQHSPIGIHNQQKQRQNAILASADGVAKYALNRGFRIFYCTEQILSIMQLTKAELPIGSDTVAFIHPDDRNRLYEEWWDAYEHHRNEPFTSRYQIQKKDGSYFKVSVNGFFTDDIYADPITGEKFPIFYLIFTNLSGR